MWGKVSPTQILTTYCHLRPRISNYAVKFVEIQAKQMNGMCESKNGKLMDLNNKIDGDWKLIDL